MHVLRIPTKYHVTVLLLGKTWPGLGKGERMERQDEGLTGTCNLNPGDGR